MKSHNIPQGMKIQIHLAFTIRYRQKRSDRARCLPDGNKAHKRCTEAQSFSLSGRCIQRNLRSSSNEFHLQEATGFRSVIGHFICSACSTQVCLSFVISRLLLWNPVHILQSHVCSFLEMSMAYKLLSISKCFTLCTAGLLFS